jgi:hypothetical protein
MTLANSGVGVRSGRCPRPDLSPDHKCACPVSQLAALDGVNTEVCEQRFRHVNRFRFMMRRMGAERFNWTLLSITEMDHRFRRLGLLGRRGL